MSFPFRRPMFLRALCSGLARFLLGAAIPAIASAQDMKEMSQKTADPTSEIALVFTQFAFTLNDGDLNGGSAKAGGQVVFQPIIPIPMYGTGLDEWRIVSRPTMTFFTEQPVPGSDGFSRKTGLSDTLLPLPLGLPKSISGKWLLALGPDFAFPTATHKAFGKQQWSAGVAGVVGYMDDNWMAGAYPQFYWGFADQGRDNDVRHARFGNIFYWWWYNLTETLQVGFSPTIQFDGQNDSDSQWNVPIGLGFSKIVSLGNFLTRIEVAAEYSVIHEDVFGERARFKINLIPVIPRPINRPIFGGE